MQRYRIDYKYFIKVLVIGIVIAVAWVFAWRFQVSNNAKDYQERADLEIKAGELRKAFKNVHYYTRLRKDDLDARVQLANLAADISKLDDAEPEEHDLAFGIVEETVRKVPDNLELRRTLVDMLIRYRRPHDAVSNIDTILAKKPNDKELLALRLQTLFATRDFNKGIAYGCKLIGLDKTTEEFDPSKAKTADQPEVYALLAEVLRRQKKEGDLAKKVVEQMVEMNPDSADAHVKYAKFLSQIHEKEKSREELEIAFSIDPTDAEVLFLGSIFAIADDDYDKAHELLSDGLEQHPDKLGFYDRLARLEATRKDLDAALKITDRGIKQFPDVKSIELRQLKINILFTRHDLEGIERELKAIADLKLPALDVVVDYERARIKFDQKQWMEASQDLKEIVPRLYQFPSIQWLAGVTLGQCYEQLGRFDLARETFGQVLEKNPDFGPAIAGRNRIDRKLHSDPSSPTTGKLNELIARELDKPKGQQHWDMIDKEVDHVVESLKVPEARANLLRAQILMKREMFDEARQLVKEAYRLDPEDVNVRLTAIRILQAEPGKGPAKALGLLDQVVEKYGDTLVFRSMRAELLMSIGDENLPEQLKSLTLDMEDWPPSQQANLWSTIGFHFQQLGLFDESRQCWNEAIELVPTNLPTRMHVFELALQQQDDEAMREAQKRILEIVKDKNDSNYLITEVKRLIIAYSKKKITLEELQEARDLISEALKQRPDWHELHILNGQLALILDSNKDFALKEFDAALKLGPPSQNAVVLQVRLLAERGLFDEAQEKMELIPLARRNALLGQLAANILFKTGENEAAIKEAKKELARNEDKPTTHIWFANIAKQLDENELAEKSLLRAVELAPKEPQYWTQLVSLYLETKQQEKIEKTLREAQLQLDSEYLPLLTAKYYELRSAWREAEDIYLSAFANRFDEIPIARRMGEFYLLWSGRDPTNRQKAAPFLNRILRAAYDEKIPGDSNNAIWAREQVARLLAASGDYQQTQKAIQLLSVARKDGRPIRSEELLTAKILAARNEPESTLKAIELLTKIKQEQPLGLENALELASLFNKAGKWTPCESQMIDMLQQHGSSPQVWATYVSLLIDHGEFDKAEQRLNRLEEIAPESSTTTKLQARLAAGQGDLSEVRKLLQTMIPPRLQLADEEQLKDIRSVAQFAAEIGDQQMAEQLYSFYVKRHPEQVLVYVRYMADHGDPGKAIELMQRLFDQKKTEILNVAVQMLQRRRTEIGDQYDDDIARFASAALRDDPESVRLQLLRAQFLETTGQYEQSIKAYEEVLAHDDASKILRAMAMNNVSFIWALHGTRLDEAISHINQAAEILGPIDDILDTRAVVEIARKEYQAAIKHMLLSLSVNPTPIKYFHLAQAQLLAGNSSEAIKAWDKATEMGLSPESVIKLEQKGYQTLVRQIDQLRSPSAKL